MPACKYMEPQVTNAEKILNEANSDPGKALELGSAYLRDLDLEDHGERSVTLRAMSVAARQVSSIEESVEFARLAAEEASVGGHENLRWFGILTMTGSMAISGRDSEALGIIEDTIPRVRDPELLARFKFQRGTVLERLGRLSDAAESLTSALADFRQLGERSAISLTLNNLGLTLTHVGRLDEAEPYLREAFELGVELGDSGLDGTEHNIGQLEFFRGDIPAALEWLQRSDEHSMEFSGSSAPQHVTRSVVLSSVGLYTEARELAIQIAEERRKRGDIEHACNALIVAAEAALAGGDVARAQQLAAEALQLIEGEPGSVRHLRARRIRDEARLAVDGPSTELLDDLKAVAEELDGFGHMVTASQAYLAAGRVAAAVGAESAARSFLDKVAEARLGPVESRLSAYLSRALIRLDDGNTRGAAAAVRSGLDLLDGYQSALGASDLRVGIEKQGAELGEIGLRLALDSGRPRRILEWLDRTRGRGLRYQPVVPSGDDAVADALSELRRIEAELRKDRDDPGLQRRRRRLQQEVAAADRVRRGTMLASERFSIDNLIDSLGGRTLFEIGEHDGRLFAVLVRKGRARVVELGEAEKVMNEVGHVRFGMRRAARLGRPVDLDALGRLDAMLLGGTELGDEMIVVPPPSLMAVPWAGLPTARDTSLTISPSAEMWWRAHQVEALDGPVLVAGGPDLGLAGAEVEAVGSLYPSPTVLAPGAGVDDVRSGLAGAGTAHVACHATFQVENPMFSSLRLGDGDLNVYDIERLDRPPGVVVLSACDSGYSEARAGDELAGLTSALLTLGTRSVVASVGLVPDSEATAALMVRFHKGLLARLPPASALAAARSVSSDDSAGFIAAASFVCIGA